jgi:hypothetical protein
MIAAFTLGFICGIFFLAVIQARMLKKYDLLMVNGKIEWVNRLDRVLLDRAIDRTFQEVEKAKE